MAGERRSPAERARRGSGGGVWIGQLATDRGQWFAVWARSRAGALRVLVEDLGDVDASTVKRVGGAGYLLFRPASDGFRGLRPSEGEALVMRDDASDAWIASTLAAGGVVAPR